MFSLFAPKKRSAPKLDEATRVAAAVVAAGLVLTAATAPFPASAAPVAAASIQKA